MFLLPQSRRKDMGLVPAMLWLTTRIYYDAYRSIERQN